ncbi:MAG: hypothetical protein IPL27_04630 [Lewinellaceae bacterium]|nr:hypothetical protein [Lewinellaceae bacterium]
MHNSPLVRTLQLLRQEELDTLYLFVQSPIFNIVRPEETLDLFEYLKKYYPLFDHQALHREQAGRHFFPQSKDSVATLHRTMTQLMAIVRKFITFQHWTAIEENAARQKGSAAPVAASMHDTRQRLALMRFYSERLHQQKAPIPAARQQVESIESESKRRERKAENFFLNLYQQAKKEIDSHKEFKNFEEYEFTDFHYFRFLLEQEKSFYEGLQENHSSDQNFLHTMEQLDEFYLLNKLDLMCKLMHHQRLAEIYDKDSDEYQRLQTNRDITRQFAHLLTEHHYLQTPAIRLYCLMLDFLTQDDPEQADELSIQIGHWMEEYPNMLPTARLRDCKIMWRSFWPSRYLETKDRRFLERLFLIQLDQLRVIGPTAGLPSSQFQNILFTALKVGRVHWAEIFYNEFKGRIIGTQQQEMIADILRAVLMFHQKEFNKAAKILPHYLHYGELDDIYLYAITATLDARIRYELDTLDSDYAENMLRATSTHIRRDDAMPMHRRDQRVRFFSFVTALDKLRQQLSRKEKISAGLAKIRKRLDQETVVDWEWLEEKYAALNQAVK